VTHLPTHHLPPSLPDPETGVQELHGVPLRLAHWTPTELETLVAHLATTGRDALGELSLEEIETAWQATVASFRDPGSPERRALDASLASLCRLSPQGLAAGLEAVLGGVAGEPVHRLFTEAADTLSDRSPVVVLLASNLPALAVQPLLPALALRRPVLLKSPSAEPVLAPAFLEALAHREPRLAAAMAALTWRGGDRELEAPVLAAAGRVLAYGEAKTVADVEARAPGRVTAYGPRTSLAVVGRDVEPHEVAAGLARDVALFDQQGCLSIAAVYVGGDPGHAEALARELAQELGRCARTWPPGPAGAAALAAVQQLRAEAEMRGLARPRVGDDAPTAGTVVVEPGLSFHPSPGLRSVRVHPLADLAELPQRLAPWRDRLQGVALAGESLGNLPAELRELGLSRLTPPGELQSPDALWHNGGLHPLTALGATSPSGARFRGISRSSRVKK